MYDLQDGGAIQAATSLRKFRERIVALERQKLDIDKAIESLRLTMADLESKLSTLRPDLLPRAGDYEQALRAGMGEPHDTPVAAE
jgi:hypothetical protein